MSPIRHSVAERFGLSFLIFPIALSFSSTLLLAVHVRISLLAVVFAVALLAICARAAGGRWWVVLGVTVVGFALLALASAAVYDVSYDGQCYQQEAVIQLARGWNPLWDPPLAEANGCIQWVNGYPKAHWFAEAAIYRATGHIEAGKALHFSLILAALFLSYATARSWSLDRRRSLAVALLAALNPVALYQMFSFYVDGMIASLLTCLLALALLYGREGGRLRLVVVAGALAFVTSLKFTGLVYAVIYAVSFGAVIYFRHRERLPPVRRAAVIGVVLGFVVLGWNPYVRNVSNGYHPFYPLYGPGAVDAVSWQAKLLDARLPGQSVPVRLVRSLFSAPSNRRMRWEMPFTATVAELTEYAAFDLRVAGLGPLFGVALALALVLALVFAPGLPPSGLAVLGLILGSCLINPAVWWARFVPQLWLLPVGITFLLFAGGKRAGWAIAALLAANILVVCAFHLAGQWQAQSDLRRILATAKKGPVVVFFGDYVATRVRLEERGIQYREGRLECPKPIVWGQSALCVSR